MSIASQITAYANGLTDAYNMVSQRGGTVPARKNMENLDTAIATIPSGGSGGQYGTLKYLPIDANNVTVTQISKTGTFSWSVPDPKKLFENARKLRALQNDETGLIFNVSSAANAATSNWNIVRVNSDGGRSTFTVQEFAALGLNLTGLGSNSKSLRLRFDNVVYDSSDPKEASLTLNDYNGLGAISRPGYSSYDQYAYSILVGDEIIERTQIIEYTFGSDCTFIPAYFCYFFNNLTKINGLENLNIEFIPDGFLNYCTSFNSPLVIPNTVTQIGDGFLSRCTNFNQPLDLKNVKAISKMSNNGNGASFLSYCSAFNSSIVAPELETGPTLFLSECFNFNQPLSFPKLKTVSQFLYNCLNFNSSLSLPVLEDAGYGFLYNCKAFNQPLSLPSLTTVSTYFMIYCNHFNQTISFPSLTTIGNNFMSNCTLFNQPFTIPSTFAPASNVTNFMFNCNSMVSTITVEASLPTVSSSAGWLAANTSTADCYVTGITIAGPERASWLTALPNETSSYYRKLIDGGA